MSAAVANQVEQLAELMREQRPCVVLTGAGISTEMRRNYRSSRSLQRLRLSPSFAISSPSFRQLRSVAEDFQPRQIVIEDAAAGQSAIQALRRESNLPITPVKAGE